MNTFVYIFINEFYTCTFFFECVRWRNDTLSLVNEFLFVVFVYIFIWLFICSFEYSRHLHLFYLTVCLPVWIFQASPSLLFDCLFARLSIPGISISFIWLFDCPFGYSRHLPIFYLTVCLPVWVFQASP